MPVRTAVLTASSYGGKLVCGCDNNTLYIYEMQSNILLAKLELHTDVITNILFSPVNSNIFYTAADDGLIHQIIPGQQPAAVDGMEDTDVNDIEDQWIGTVINMEQSIKRIGFFGPKHQFLYCISTTETLSLWFTESGERVSDEFVHVRQQLTEQCHITIDYLIDCYFDMRSQRLFLAAGTNTGQLLLAHVNRNSIQSIGLCTLQQQYTAHTELLHTNTIRDIFWYNNIILSVGEDCRICGWTCDSALLQQTTQLDNTIKQIQQFQHSTHNHTTTHSTDTDVDTAPHIVHKPDGSCCKDTAMHMNSTDDTRVNSDSSDTDTKSTGKRSKSANNNGTHKIRRTKVNEDSS